MSRKSLLLIYLCIEQFIIINSAVKENQPQVLKVHDIIVSNTESVYESWLSEMNSYNELCTNTTRILMQQWVNINYKYLFTQPI